jgi:hypothetical protein
VSGHDRTYASLQTFPFHLRCSFEAIPYAVG